MDSTLRCIAAVFCRIQVLAMRTTGGSHDEANDTLAEINLRTSSSIMATFGRGATAGRKSPPPALEGPDLPYSESSSASGDSSGSYLQVGGLKYSLPGDESRI